MCREGTLQRPEERREPWQVAIQLPAQSEAAAGQVCRAAAGSAGLCTVPPTRAGLLCSFSPQNPASLRKPHHANHTHRLGHLSFLHTKISQANRVWTDRTAISAHHGHTHWWSPEPSLCLLGSAQSQLPSAPPPFHHSAGPPGGLLLRALLPASWLFCGSAVQTIAFKNTWKTYS